MTHRDILVKAVEMLNTIKHTGIEIADIWGEVDGDIHVRLRYNKVKDFTNEQILHFKWVWFKWDSKIDTSIREATKNANIPEDLPEETKVMLRLAYEILEIMVANGFYERIGNN